MCLVGNTPVHRLMEEEAARQKARNDWTYFDEMRRLSERRGLYDVVPLDKWPRFQTKPLAQ